MNRQTQHGTNGERAEQRVCVLVCERRAARSVCEPRPRAAGGLPRLPPSHQTEPARTQPPHELLAPLSDCGGVRCGDPGGEWLEPPPEAEKAQLAATQHILIGLQHRLQPQGGPHEKRDDLRLHGRRLTDAPEVRGGAGIGPRV